MHPPTFLKRNKIYIRNTRTTFFNLTPTHSSKALTIFFFTLSLSLPPFSLCFFLHFLLPFISSFISFSFPSSSSHFFFFLDIEKKRKGKTSSRWHGQAAVGHLFPLFPFFYKVKRSDLRIEMKGKGKTMKEMRRGMGLGFGMGEFLEVE